MYPQTFARGGGTALGACLPSHQVKGAPFPSAQLRRRVVPTLEVIVKRVLRLPTVLTVVVVLTLAVTLIAPWLRPQLRARGSDVSGGPFVRIDTDLAARLDDAGERSLSESNVAGFSVAVARKGTVVFADGFGFADLQGEVPASADTVYGIGSITKQFTAAAMLRLQEHGRLALDDDIGMYLPGYPSHGQPITIRQILTHTSGIPELTAQPSYRDAAGAAVPPETIMREVLSQPPDFAPGTQWRYSNSGYVLAGMIIERVTGLSYDTYLTEKLLGSLGLRHTSVCPDRSSAPYARGYEQQTGSWTRAIRLGEPLPLVPAGPVDLSIASSAGAGCSTVLELLAWTEALRSGRVVSPASYRLMTTPASLADGRTVPYGLGLFLRHFGTHRAIVHEGIIENGFVGVLADFPDDGLTVAVLANTLISDPESFMAEILKGVFDEPDATWDVPDMEPASSDGRSP
jgi:CubicO group peptidase (beta-lactamase class C family)